MISKKLDIKDNLIIILYFHTSYSNNYWKFFLNFYLLCFFLIFIFDVFKTKKFDMVKR